MIKVHIFEAQDHAVWIAKEHIVYFTHSDNGGTWISLVSGKGFYVTEALEDVEKMMFGHPRVIN